MSDVTPIADLQQRRRALDPEGSFIVQAPAGSGKTELLTQRILALLARVERPEEVLAITFTRKAAAEMRARLLRALARAENPEAPQSAHERTTWQLARAALDQDRRCNWQLRRNPNALQLVTIDSFCAHLVRRMPWLSRFGAPPAICDDPRDDYRHAAERVLLQGLAGSTMRKPVAVLLRHLDNRLEVLRDMLVAMLARRDQWLRHLLGQRHEQSRAVLEQGLADYVTHHLLRLEGMLDGDKEELLTLARYAGSNLDPDGVGGVLAGLVQFPEATAERLAEWLGLVELLLTKNGEVRSRVTKGQGFPADKQEPALSMKERMQQFLDQLRSDAALTAALADLRRLPHPEYFDHQWRVLQALVDLLPLAAAELDQVFREQGHIDFIAIASGARVALGESESPEELLLQLDSRISHILVDEFQDTSFAQFELLERLVAGWQPDDGRTLFLVGDPMQSIYRFREAEVGLFLRAMHRGVGSVSLESLQLSVNFRSQAGVVEWNNRLFAGLFPQLEDEALGAITFASALPHKSVEPGEAAELVLFGERDDGREAALLVERIEATIHRDPHASHAILVRSRGHAYEIARVLKEAGLRFQAQELEPLDKRQPVLDLLALTRALVHPGDRLAWQTILRAPWCGLRLESLLTLCEGDRHTPLWSLLNDPARLNWLAVDERERLLRFNAVLENGLERRGREPLARVVYAAWLALGGPACWEDADCEDARQYLHLLSDLEQGGDLLSLESLEQALTGLYAAPDPGAGAQLQIMTIHKSKGLEFDHVYLPGLGRTVRGQDKELLRWMEHPDFGLLLAPVPAHAGQAGDATYSAIGDLHAAKNDFETVRLLYVACTRARRSLTLSGHLKSLSEPLRPPGNSLLAVAWDRLMAEERYTLIDAPVDDLPHNVTEPQLCRLPPGWCAPRPAPPLPVADHQMRRASDEGNLGDTSPDAGAERRFIGTVVHGWLERIAQQGLDHWSLERLDEMHERIKRQLLNLGCPAPEVVTAAQDVERCLAATLSGEKGRWVLHDHTLGECELPLSGLYEGERIEAVVDRTFVDERDVRWIIDYKTSSPRHDEQMPAFLEREQQRYFAQISSYVTLFAALEPSRRVVGALYFPTLDTLHVVAEHYS